MRVPKPQLILAPRNEQLGILYVPDNGVGTEILLMRPSNPIMSWAYQMKIRLIGKLFECAAFQIGFDIKNT
jgi:hypothetical protein